ncbi:MAG: phosphatase PAP2 family protein [Deltaproteobacteria bacterium]|nr:phosphatase PAP2 family protein [Deltaproteobacteria bacterium]
MLETLTDLDRSLFYAVNRDTKNIVFDYVMPILSWEYLWVPILAIIILFIIRGSARTRWGLIILILVFGAGDSLNSRVLKSLADRPRPYTVLGQVNLYSGHWSVTPATPPKPPNHTESFPSSHAVNAIAAAVVLTWFFRSLWPLTTGLAVLICYSRIYVGAHYPLDVLAGALVGLTLAFLVLLIQDRMIGKARGHCSWAARVSVS